ncbi:Putative cyclase [Legionella massiliensis]|uniref:Putative cyclase n=1 Tax=Legionella massiliensis TaxID=1034943 RepID=A0A078KYZ2_9GAMM|nr:cyclase family protein [Legionella massiliensis]CDZ76984.1 Putative cyclase [Legionella massiliensis]CEE12722.1 Kynurenine formamidase [Legionella massiliensis]
MAKKFIDLSINIENDVKSDPEGYQPAVQYLTHQQTVGELTQFFPGLTAADLPASEAWAYERINLITHNGTHLDAPYHFSTLMDKDKRAITIDEVPLEWCFQDGIKLDFRHFPNGYVVTKDDVQAELERIQYQLKPLDIVLVNTSAGLRYGHDDYVHSGCGMGREATLFLLEQGVKITGTDGWSWDAPFLHTREKYLASKDASLIWEGHKASREISYCHLEKLHNLECLPSHGFTVSCFPVKIKGASAGWTRAVAIL